MLISELRLSGWKSYSEDGISLENFKKINLLIGPNNVGKSNLLKYLLFLRGIFPEGNNTFEEIDVSHFKVDYTDRWLFADIPVKFGVTIEDYPPHEFFYRTKPESISLEANHNYTGKFSEFSVLNPTGIDETKATIFWRHFISNHVRFIGDVRGFVHNTTGNLDVHVDGTKILKFLLEKVGTDDGWITQYQNKMSKWLKDILLEEELIFEFVPENNPDFHITVLRGPEKNPIRFKPRQLGTGIAHLVLILTTLHACSHNKINIFLEEPEMNLHPQSVVALTKILKEDFINHRFFIFTHSNVWLDQIDENYGVYNFYKSGDNSTHSRNCTDDKDFYLIFEKLGIRPSQLLLSNFNIWIEGPSDRIYINYWINKYSRGALTEGKHYSFVMYGGTNLSHYDLVLSDLINILSIGYNTAIICDSDLSEKRESIKDRVQKINDRILEKDLEKYSMLWITEGREIENYVPKKLFEAVLITEPFIRSYIQHNGKRANLSLSNEENEDDYKITDSYDDFFIYLYKFDVNQIRTRFADSINDEQDFVKLMDELEEKRRNVLKNMSKVEIAKAVTAEWNNFRGEDEYDLKSKIDELIERIKAANGIS